MVAKKNKTIFDRIEHLGPCDESRKWAKKQTSPTRAWRACQRGDWMLWLIGCGAVEPESDARRRLVLCCCDCARTALPFTNDPRVLACIEATEKWAHGKATIGQVIAARAIAATYTYVAYRAADAAVYAADVAAFAANADAESVNMIASAVVSAAADTAGTKTEKIIAAMVCADIVRRHYPKPPKVT